MMKIGIQAIHIIGMSIITSNAEAFAKNTIGQLWANFVAQPIKGKLKQMTSKLAINQSGCKDIR